MRECLAAIVPIKPLKNLFTILSHYTYIITTTFNSECHSDDNSIMLSMYTLLSGKKSIITARSEKFLKKYDYYHEQLKNKSLEEIDYGDDEVAKGGYFSEDQLFIDFLKDIPFNLTIDGINVQIIE
ncbi:hypothetical protein RclHR1_03460012 [Rhizophagus clarus]|nr:hypothetical protein RclHR1_03460012 [Rhizophagus clarus]